MSARASDRIKVSIGARAILRLGTRVGISENATASDRNGIRIGDDDTHSESDPETGSERESQSQSA